MKSSDRIKKGLDQLDGGRNWIRHAYHGQDMGTRCMVGSMFEHTVNRYGVERVDLTDQDVFGIAQKYLYPALMDLHPDFDPDGVSQEGAVFNFNDAQRDFEPIKEVMEHAAKLAEAQGD